MDKTNNIPEAENKQVELLSAESRKTITKIAAVVLGVVAVVLIYVFAIHVPSVNKANEAIGAVDAMAMNATSDSLLIEAYAEVAANHGGDAAARANYMAAVLSYQNGDYEKALGFIEEYNGSDVLVASMANGIKGDCLVNLDRNAEAVKAFDAAISAADDTDRLVVYFMTKKATVLSAMGEHKKAAAIYEEIVAKYPTVMPGNTKARMLQEKGLASSAE